MLDIALTHPSSHRLSNLIEGLRTRSLAQRILAAFAFGMVAALGCPPTGFFPLFWISFPALIFLLQGAPNFLTAFLTGWSFAFGYFLLGLYWIAAAMFVDIGTYWWGIPLAAAGLPAFFAIQHALLLTVAWRLGLKGVTGAITFALAWFLGDYARGHLFTGYPWNLEGYGWTKILPVMQIVSITGIYGLTLLTVFAASLPAALADKKRESRIALMLSLTLFALIGAWGALRLWSAPLTNVPHVRLRIVQPNIDQAHKWMQSEREQNYRKLLDLSAAPAEKPVTHIIWPETASTFYLSEDAPHRNMIGDFIPAEASVLTGVIRRSGGPGDIIQYYNSLVAVNGFGQMLAGYDKHHLVPFGEYIPLRQYIPIKALAMGVDFTPGEGPRTLRVLGLPPFSPLICYEAIFPGDVTEPDDPPKFLLNITNDGWYYKTAGPYQHFAIAATRAIEEGMPLIRAANTGISGVIDPWGRITAHLALGATGYLDADLPEALNPTLFHRWREKPLWAIFTILAAGTLLGRFFQRATRN